MHCHPAQEPEASRCPADHLFATDAHALYVALSGYDTTNDQLCDCLGELVDLTNSTWVDRVAAQPPRLSFADWCMWCGTIKLIMGQGLMSSTAVDLIERCEDLKGWEQMLWDPRESVGSYAMFAALLAGFSLSGVLWISSTDPSRGLSRSRAVPVIWASFVPLVIATLLYAEIAGSHSCEQSVVEVSIPSLVLSLGTVGLFVSLSKLLAKVFDVEGDRSAITVAWTAIVVGTLGVYTSNRTLYLMLQGDGWPTAGTRVQTGLLVVAILLGGGIHVSHWRAWRPRLVKRYAAIASNGLPYVLILSSLGFVALNFATTPQALQQSTPNVIAWSKVLVWVVFSLMAAGTLSHDDQ